MHRLVFALSMVALLATGTVGCGEETAPPADSNQSANEETDQNDGEGFEVYDPGGEDRETVLKFIVENGATVPVYFQVRTEQRGEPNWLKLSREGDELRLEPNCMPRICGEDKKPACEELEPEVAKVEPGDEMTWSWDGRHYETGDECTEPVDAEDIDLGVEICWGREIDEENQQIRETNCAGDDGFNPAESTEVTITVS